MIKTKPILFFDEGVTSLGTKRVIDLIESCEEFDSLVEFHTELTKHFDLLDYSGNDIKLKFDPNSVELIFIHQSFNAPSMIQSNHFDVLKAILGAKLIRFSGDAKTSIESGTLRRDDVYLNFINFLEFYNLTGEPSLRIFTERNFIRFYSQGLLENIRDLIEESIENALNSLSYFTLLKILKKEPERVTEKLMELEETEIIEYLDNQISML